MRLHRGSSVDCLGYLCRSQNKIALNLDNPKKDSGVLILAEGLSLACFIGILLSSLVALFWSFGKQWPHVLEIIESGMASFTYLPFLIAPIAVPILFIRNIYAHIK